MALAALAPSCCVAVRIVCDLQGPEADPSLLTREDLALPPLNKVTQVLEARRAKDQLSGKSARAARAAQQWRDKDYENFTITTHDD